MHLKVHKNLQRAVGERVLPKFICDREKNYHTDGPNEKFMEAYREQYRNLVNKYLKDRSREIFKIINFVKVIHSETFTVKKKNRFTENEIYIDRKRETG